MTELNESLYIFPIIIIIMTFCMINILFFVGNRKSNTTKKTIQNYTLYILVVIGLIVSIIMFKEASIEIKRDVLLNIQNSKEFSGVVSPHILVIVTFIGGVFGGIWAEIENHVKRNKYK